MKTLDITEFREKGRELFEAIEKAVGDTQRVLIQDLPNEILMTNTQFDDLNSLSGFTQMYKSKDRLFQTRYNVMEVRVKE